MIRPVIFVSFEQGKIEERPNDFRGCFSILKHYPLLYAAYREKHKIIRSFYGHPHTERPEKVYNGTQREGPDVFHGDFREANSFREKRLLKRIMHESRRHAALRTEAEARAAFDMLKHPEQYEIIHTKVAGSNDAYLAMRFVDAAMTPVSSLNFPDSGTAFQSARIRLAADCSSFRCGVTGYSPLRIST